MGSLHAVGIDPRPVVARTATGRIPEERRVCPFCHGSGVCGKCDGTGKRVAKHGWFRRHVLVACVACDATKKCGLCGGKGTVVTGPVSLTAISRYAGARHGQDNGDASISESREPT